jgi:hypothetical protein
LSIAEIFLNFPTNRKLGREDSFIDIEGNREVQFFTVKSASSKFGNSSQYLRKLLREGKLRGNHLGEIWFIEFRSIENIYERGIRK